MMKISLIFLVLILTMKMNRCVYLMSIWEISMNLLIMRKHLTIVNQLSQLRLYCINSLYQYVMIIIQKFDTIIRLIIITIISIVINFCTV